MTRWGIVLGNQLIFSTDDEDVARRFMAVGSGFRVLDHHSGYYVYMDALVKQASDLLVGEATQED